MPPGEALGLGEDNSQIVFIPLRRNRAVQHGLQESVDGGQGRAEIVGDICDKFFLIILRTRNRVCHVAQGSSQVSQFVFALDRDVVVHVSKGILFGRGDDAPQRTIDIFCEKQEDDERQDDQEDQFHIGYVQNAVRVPADLFHGHMNDNIAADFETAGDGNCDTEDLFVKGIKKGAGRIVVSGCKSGIEALDDGLFGGIGGLPGIDDHAAGGVEDPDLRVHIGGQGFHLPLDDFQRNPGIVEVGRVGIGNMSGLSIQEPGLVPDTVFHCYSGDNGGHCEKSEQAEEQVGDYDPKVKRFSHGRT